VLQVITDRKTIDRAQGEFVRLMQKALTYKKIKTIGFHGGQREEEVYYNDSLWFTSSTDLENENRYWTPIGVVWNKDAFERPGLVDIRVELNFPFSLNRNAGGVLLEDADNDGDIYIGHRGKVGGGRKGIGKTAFMSFYKGPTQIVLDVDRETEVIVISELKSENLLRNIGEFVKSVEIFKNAVVNGYDFEKAESPKEFRKEQEKRRPYSLSAQIDSEVWWHGRVVNRLFEKLQTMGKMVTKTPSIDLMLVDSKGRMTHIFEVKSGSDSQSVYTAIGQLMYHAEPTVKQIAVLPSDISGARLEKLNELGIHVVTFEGDGVEICFRGLEGIIKKRKS